MCRYQLIYFVTHAVVRLNQSSTTTKLQIAQLIQSSKNRSKQRTLQNLSLLIPWGSSPLPLGCKPPECINRGRLDDWQLAAIFYFCSPNKLKHHIFKFTWIWRQDAERGTRVSKNTLYDTFWQDTVVLKEWSTLPFSGSELEVGPLKVKFGVLRLTQSYPVHHAISLNETLCCVSWMSDSQTEKQLTQG